MLSEGIINLTEHKVANEHHCDARDIHENLTFHKQGVLRDGAILHVPCEPCISRLNGESVFCW